MAISRATQPAAYNPTPNTACVTTLCIRARFGRGVRLAAIPAPIAGCISRKGAATLPMPTINAGASVGWRAQ